MDHPLRLFRSLAVLTLIQVLVIGLLLAVHGCTVPVCVRPETDTQGKQIPVLTTIEPRQDSHGQPIPVPVAQTQPAPLAPRPEFADVATRPAPVPVPPAFDWTSLLMPILAALGIAGGGWGVLASRAAGVLRVALTATAAHADRMEAAETDADVAKAKATAQIEQSVLGVTKVIRKARGKA